MTAQFSEWLNYQGEEHAMFTNPLSDYYAMTGLKSPFSADCSALWRGYVGTWEILGGRLYLIRLKGSLEDGGTASLETVFPGFPDRVFAHWYSGTIRLPQGRRLEYVHKGYMSRFEREEFLDIERGVLVSTRLRHNTGLSESGKAGRGRGVS